MPGTYTIKFTDQSKEPILVQPLTVYPNTQNTPPDPAFPLTFAGYRYPQYGESLWTNMLRMLENFAGTTAPVGAIEGQIWVDTSTGTGIPKFLGTDNTWHEIGAGVWIGTGAPLGNSHLGLWYNPSDHSLTYWNGSAWENILCLLYAAAAEYNDIAGQLNAAYGALDSTLSRVALIDPLTRPTDAQWLDVIARVRALATTQNVATTAIKDTTFKLCSNTTATVNGVPALIGMRYLQTAYDAIITALTQLNSVAVVRIPGCLDLVSPVNGAGGAVRQRTAPWGITGTATETINHTVTVSFSNSTTADRYFLLGGEVIWNGSNVGAANNTNGANWTTFLATLPNLRVLNSSIMLNTTVVNTFGYSALTSSPVTIYTAHASAGSTYTPNATVVFAASKTNGVITITVTMSDPDHATWGATATDGVTGTLTSQFSFKAMRVSSTCATSPVETPTCVSTGNM
jgi:hypothetical protein